MKQRLSLISRASMALAIAMSLNIGSAVAATPSSSLNALPERINTQSVTLSYVTSGDGGEISKVELYSKKDDGVFMKIATVTTPNDAFVIDFMTSGDGRYAFHTIAYLKNGTETIDDDVAETGKDLLEETVTTVDTVSPPAPDATHLYVNQSASLTTNEISGYSLAVEGSAKVYIYSNPELTRLLATTTSTASGSFGPVEIGSTASQPYVWLVAVDANGNRSVATLRKNELSYPYQATNVIVTAVSGTQLDVTYTATPGAQEYIVYYRHAGGAVWSAMVRTTETTVHLTGLEAGRAYDVRVAPVDSTNSVGMYVFASVRTSGTPLNDVVLASEVKATSQVASAAGVGGSTVTDFTTSDTTTTTTPESEVSSETTKPATPATTDTPATTTDGETAPDQEPAADGTTPDEGAAPAEEPVDGEEATDDQAADENQPSSATPWVILAILIILAGIATGGYFYWFSGPEEVTTTMPEEKTETTEKTEEKKEDDADKRW